MTSIIITITLLLGGVGISIVIWSYVNTRNKFYKEYISRKRGK